jgi:hypothetical protein
MKLLSKSVKKASVTEQRYRNGWLPFFNLAYLERKIKDQIISAGENINETIIFTDYHLERQFLPTISVIFINLLITQLHLMCAYQRIVVPASLYSRHYP